VAEYTALLRGLEEAIAMRAQSVCVFTDSELLAHQLNGVYKVKAPHLRPLYDAARGLMARFRQDSVSHVPREKNAEADKLASRATTREKLVFEPEPDVAETGGGQRSLF
jgi:ribonuclease HI